MKISLRSINLHKVHQRGQVLPLALAVLIVACVMFFLVFNSGRAVNEKINLVNAADAAAYSGAQIAARHLNFMAYTNRAMVANEAAIGHLYSFQVEAELLGNIVKDGINGGGLIGDLIRLILTAIDPNFPTYVAFLNQLIQPLVDSSKVFTGMLTLMLDANNATFANFQEQAYMDLIQADPVTSQTVVDRAMSVVANSYIERESAPILLNDEGTISNFIGSENQAISAAAQMASAGAAVELCEMILFAMPGAEVANALGSAHGARSQDCKQAVNGGSELSLAIPGTPMSPEADGGLMIDALRQTVEQMENATWIRDRNVDNYSIFGIFRADRAGSTQPEFDNASGNINWTSQDDSFRLKFAGIPFYSTSLSSDAALNVDEATAIVDDLAIQGLRLFGLCGSESAVDCDELAENSYDSIQRYAALDPNRDKATVTAFLEQSNCSDNIGYDDNGAKLEGWQDSLEVFEDQTFCGDKNVYAIGQAEVYFQRPDCYQNGNATCPRTGNGFSRLNGGAATEQPNLFNPFWHARLVATGR